MRVVYKYSLLYFLAYITTIECKASVWPLGPNNQGPQCGAPDINRVYSFSVPAQYTDPNNQVRAISAYYIKYDAEVNGAISSTAYHDVSNSFKPSQTAPPWSRWGCPELAAHEYNCATSFALPYSRGHLTPKCPQRFSATAYAATFKCVNQVPQIQVGFNDRGWAYAEECAAKIAEAGGFIMTGVCESRLTNPPIPVPAQHTPSCFWKLVCYKQGGVTYVAGFHSENVVTSNPIANNILSQQEVSNLIGSQFYDAVIYDTWTDARPTLISNRQSINDAPTANDCRTALDLNTNEKNRLKGLNECRARRSDSRQCVDACYCDPD